MINELKTSDLSDVLGCDEQQINDVALSLGLLQIQELAAQDPDNAKNLVEKLALLGK